MQLFAKQVSNEDQLPLRTRHRQEMNCQIVHDSIHRREGWTTAYLLESAGTVVGFGSIAIDGPWQEKPTIFEFYILPEQRCRAYLLFEILLECSGARFFEVQSNDVLLTSLALTRARKIEVEKIIFADAQTTAHVQSGAILRPACTDEEVMSALERRQGGGEWFLEVDGKPAGKGGLLFHYNRPFGDIYMEINDAERRRGLGAFLVQEIKRKSYELGAVPCARCNPDNAASYRTLQSAGFVPFAQILVGALGNFETPPADQAPHLSESQQNQLRSGTQV